LGEVTEPEQGDNDEGLGRSSKKEGEEDQDPSSDNEDVAMYVGKGGGRGRVLAFKDDNSEGNAKDIGDDAANVLYTSSRP
jgi:hypothetical protein